MASLNSSTRFLSTLIRFETPPAPVCSTRWSVRVPSLWKPRSFSTYTSTISEDSRGEKGTQTEAEVLGGRGRKADSKRPEAAILDAPDNVEARPYSRETRQRLAKPRGRDQKPSFIYQKAADPRTNNAKQSEPESGEKNSHQRPREHWQTQKEALKKKFGEQGWNPRKKLSPDTMEGIRALHEQFPQKYTTAVLAEQFKVSPEAIRRMLKSKWRPSPEKMEERRARWAKRHDRIWDAQAEMGLRPQRTKDRKPEGPEKLDEIIPLVPNIGP